MQIGHNLSTDYSLINEQNGERPNLEITTEEKDVYRYVFGTLYNIIIHLVCHCNVTRPWPLL